MYCRTGKRALLGDVGRHGPHQRKQGTGKAGVEQHQDVLGKDFEGDLLDSPHADCAVAEAHRILCQRGAVFRDNVAHAGAVRQALGFPVTRKVEKNPALLFPPDLVDDAVERLFQLPRRRVQDQPDLKTKFLQFGRDFAGIGSGIGQLGPMIVVAHPDDHGVVILVKENGLSFPGGEADTASLGGLCRGSRAECEENCEQTEQKRSFHPGPPCQIRWMGSSPINDAVC